MGDLLVHPGKEGGGVATPVAQLFFQPRNRAGEQRTARKTFDDDSQRLCIGGGEHAVGDDVRFFGLAGAAHGGLGKATEIFDQCQTQGDGNGP